MTERQALESTYWDKLTTYRRKNVTDNITKLTHQEEIIVIESVPCALSKSKNSLIQGEAATSENTYTLFCSPDIDLKAGDKVVITCQSGQVKTCYSSEPFIYPNSHLEATLTEKGYT